jgi:hypothetical protein
MRSTSPVVFEKSSPGFEGRFDMGKMVRDAQVVEQEPEKETAAERHERLEAAKWLLAHLDVDGDGSLTKKEIMMADKDGSGEICWNELKHASAQRDAARLAQMEALHAAQLAAQHAAESGPKWNRPDPDYAPAQLVQWLNIQSGRNAPYTPPKAVDKDVGCFAKCLGMA